MSNEFDPDWPHGHVTRDGRKARIICKDVAAVGGENIVALLSEVNGGEYPRIYFHNGTYIKGLEDGADLFNAPAPKRKFAQWMNIYRESLEHLTKEDADKSAAGLPLHRIACVYVSGEEGDGL